MNSKQRIKKAFENGATHLTETHIHYPDKKRAIHKSTFYAVRGMLKREGDRYVRLDEEKR